MTTRCRHELETKPDYPEDRICRKCQTVWRLTDYKGWKPTQLMTLPKEIRLEIMKIQAEELAKSGTYEVL